MHQDCSKTAFFDEWHFLSSECFLCVTLINKAAPRRARRETRELCVCVRLRPCVYVCEGGRERLVCVCVCVKEIFGFWIVRCDLGTLIFTQQASITLVVVLFTVFLLWQSTRFPSEQRGGLFFFFFQGFFFVKHWILKESKVKSGIPCSEVCYPQKNEGEWEFNMTRDVLY